MGKDLNGKDLGKGIVQRPNGTYEARYVDRFKKRHSFYGTDLKTLRKKLEKARYEDENGMYQSRTEYDEVKITIGENVLYKNGEAIELDCAAEITNDRTMVPVRAIGEAFGCTVNWNNEMKTVEITK